MVGPSLTTSDSVTDQADGSPAATTLELREVRRRTCLRGSRLFVEVVLRIRSLAASSKEALAHSLGLCHSLPFRSRHLVQGLAWKTKGHRWNRCLDGHPETIEGVEWRAGRWQEVNIGVCAR